MITEWYLVGGLLTDCEVQLLTDIRFCLSLSLSLPLLRTSGALTVSSFHTDRSASLH